MPTRILVVEDDQDIAQLVARYLEKAGFVPEVVSSGRDALTAIAAQAPDLIVLDLMLPQVDGLEVCRAVRGREATAAIPIIMLTARAEESDRIVGLELGDVLVVFDDQDARVHERSILPAMTRDELS